MAQTEDEQRQDDDICMFPGCDRPVIDTKDRGFGDSYTARYCDLDEHNVANMYHALKEQEADAGS